jgi:hypothetical protein
MQFLLLLLLLSESLYVMQVDVMHIKKPLVLFQWMGMNALIVYVLAACELFPTLIQGFYWRSPENNLVRVFCISITCHISCRLCIELLTSCRAHKVSCCSHVLSAWKIIRRSCYP